MRPAQNPLVEKYRLLKHPILHSTKADGNNGAFVIPNPRGPSHGDLICIVSDGRDAKELGINKWEHVSVHVGMLQSRGGQRTPIWDEMCYVKKLFFEDDEVVMQLHPAKKDYVNVHDHTLHLWRPVDSTIPMPEKTMV